MIAACRGIEPLVSLFKSQLEDVLVNVVNAVRILCLGNHDNQDVVAKYGGLEHLVEFLELPSGKVLEVLIGNKDICVTECVVLLKCVTVKNNTI